MTKRSIRLLALLAAFALAAAACGGGDDDGGSANGSGSGGEGALAEYDLSGVSITVGSKDFTEQLVLGELLVQAFEAAGADVNNKVNLGGTEVNRQALVAGEIDTYAEYNGTGWMVHLGREDPVFDSEELTANVAEADLEENGIRWLGRSPFNNTYGFAVNREYVEEHGEPNLKDMAEHLKANPGATVCMESEFPDRSDGLVLFEEHTGFKIPDSQVSILDTNLIYTETASGGCTFGEIFETDGRIPGLDLTVVEADGVFIIYNVSINLRDEVYQQAPEAFDAIAELLLADMTNDVAQQLNSRVGVDGEDQATVAREYLQEKGLI